MVININTNDLENASTAETNPFDNAVNIPLANILNPIKNNAIVQIRLPVTAKSYTGFSGRANTETSGFVNIKDTATVKTEIAAITFKLIATNFFSFDWLSDNSLCAARFSC